MDGDPSFDREDYPHRTNDRLTLSMALPERRFLVIDGP